MPQNASKFLKISQNIHDASFIPNKLLICLVSCCFFFATSSHFVHNMFAKVCFTEVKFQRIAGTLSSSAGPKGNVHLISIPYWKWNILFKFYDRTNVINVKHVKTQLYTSSQAVSSQVMSKTCVIGAIYCFHVIHDSKSQTCGVYVSSWCNCATSITCFYTLAQSR